MKVLYSNINVDRVKEVIHKQQRVEITQDDFMAIYKDATRKKYHALIIDERNP